MKVYNLTDIFMRQSGLKHADYQPEKNKFLKTLVRERTLNLFESVLRTLSTTRFSKSLYVNVLSTALKFSRTYV